MFIAVVAVGIWVAQSGALTLSRCALLRFVTLGLPDPGAGRGAGVPRLAQAGHAHRFRRLAAGFHLWHPLQTWLNLPYGRPEFTDPAFSRW